MLNWKNSLLLFGLFLQLNTACSKALNCGSGDCSAKPQIGIEGLSSSDAQAIDGQLKVVLERLGLLDAMNTLFNKKFEMHEIRIKALETKMDEHDGSIKSLLSQVKEFSSKISANEKEIARIESEAKSRVDAIEAKQALEIDTLSLKVMDLQSAMEAALAGQAADVASQVQAIMDAMEAQRQLLSSEQESLRAAAQVRMDELQEDLIFAVSHLRDESAFHFSEVAQQMVSLDGKIEALSTDYSSQLASHLVAIQSLEIRLAPLEVRLDTLDAESLARYQSLATELSTHRAEVASLMASVDSRLGVAAALLDALEAEQTSLRGDLSVTQTGLEVLKTEQTSINETFQTVLTQLDGKILTLQNDFLSARVEEAAMREALLGSILSLTADLEGMKAQMLELQQLAGLMNLDILTNTTEINLLRAQMTATEDLILQQNVDIMAHIDDIRMVLDSKTTCTIGDVYQVVDGLRVDNFRDLNCDGTIVPLEVDIP